MILQVLVLLLAIGAEHADFRRIFDAHVGQVWRSLRFLGVREPDLEDVSQEVFMVVLNRLPDFEGRSSMATWIYGICLRVAAGYRRRNQRPSAEPSTIAEQFQPANQEQELQIAQHVTLLSQILQTLDNQEREAFVLFEIEELAMTEIAKILDCPLRTAYLRLETARTRVRRAWILAEARGA